MENDQSAQFQANTNKTIISTVTDAFHKMNHKWTYIPPGLDKGIMKTSSQYWTPKNVIEDIFLDGEKVSRSIPTLVFNGSIENLYIALQDLIEKDASLECTIAITTAKIICLKNLLDKGQFMSYAKWFYHKLEASYGNADKFFHFLPVPFLKTISCDQLIPGNHHIPAIIYITNIPEYAEFKPDGNGRGINVFCTGENQYIGFGETYKEGPRQLEYIESNDLLAEFTKTNDVQKYSLKHEIYTSLFEEYPSTFSAIRCKAQESVKTYEIFDAERLYVYINYHDISIPESLIPPDDY